MSAEPPPALGPYRVIRKIAEGGMGAVYEVQHTETHTPYALKTLLPGVASVDDALEELERFRREALALARLNHPHVARIHAAVLDGPQPYLVQDLLTGGSLHDRLRAGPLPPAEALETAAKLSRGLAHAHAHGILHRDLKPQNVMFDGQGEPVLVDFGLALRVGDRSRLTETGTVMGTPSFMPPEQARGDRAAIDERSDVYGLGAVFYAMLTGHPPFSGGALLALLNAVLEQAPTPPTELVPEIPPHTEALCLRALAKAPDDRYPSAAAFADALESPEAVARERRRGPLLIAGGIAACGILVGLALRSSPSPPPSPLVEAEASPTAEVDLEAADPADAAAQEAFLARLAKALDHDPEAADWRRVEARFEPVLQTARMVPALEQAFAHAFARLLRRPGPLAPHAEALGAAAARLGLDAEQVRSAKRAAWRAEQGRLEASVAAAAAGAAGEYRRLSAIHGVAPEVRTGVVSAICARAFARLLDAEQIEAAVELQVARNRFQLIAPFRLRQVVEKRDQPLEMLRVGVAMSRLFALKRLRGISQAREATDPLPADSQVRAFAGLAGLKFDITSRTQSQTQLLEGAAYLQKILQLPDKDLAPRYVAEAELLLSYQHTKMTRNRPPWIEIAASARRARRFLLQTPGDPLLIEACRQEALALTEANQLDRAEKIWKEAEAATNAFLAGPRAGELGRLDRPGHFQILVLIEFASFVRLARKDPAAALEVARGALSSCDRVSRECRRGDVSPRRAKQHHQELRLGAVNEILRALEDLGRHKEAYALGDQYDRREIARLNPDFSRRMVGYHLKRGYLERADERLRWLEHDYAKGEWPAVCRGLRERLEAARAKRKDGPG